MITINFTLSFTLNIYYLVTDLVSGNKKVMTLNEIVRNK